MFGLRTDDWAETNGGISFAAKWMKNIETRERKGTDQSAQVLRSQSFYEEEQQVFYAVVGEDPYHLFQIEKYDAEEPLRLCNHLHT